MRKITKNKVTGEKFLWQASVVLFLLGLFLFAAPPKALAAPIDPCDYTYRFPVTRNFAPLAANQTNQATGFAAFDIYRSGSKTFRVDLGIDLPDITVLKVHLNGALIGEMEPADISGQEIWFLYVWDAQAPVANVGDIVTITKDAEQQPSFSGRFIRKSYDWGFVGGFVRPVSSYQYACSTARGYIYLPNSLYRRYLLITPNVLTPSPVTKITVNGPSFYPGGIGDEIAEVPIISSNPTDEIYGWIRTYANHDDIRLSEGEYQQLRQGLLTVNVFTAQHPNGFAQIPIEIFLLNASGDFEGDGKADFAVFRPTDRNWYLLYSSNNHFQSVPFGLPSDKLVIGDYDSDGKTDIAAYQTENADYPGLGVWQIRNSSGSNYIRSIQWGLPDDIPLAVDIDKNNTSDLAVYRPSNGTWYIQSSLDNSLIGRQFGLTDDIPVPADFDKDGVNDIAVFRPSNGTWYVSRSSDNSFFASQFGASGDVPAMGQR